MHQKKLVLDYSQSVSDSSWGPLTSFVNAHRAAFFARSGWCPYCQAEVPKVFDENAMWAPENNDDPCREEYYWTQVWSCQSCGWWDIFDSQNSGHDSVDPVYVSETVRHGVLLTYDISEAEVPISALRTALRRWGDEILHVQPRVMEELVAAVLRDYFPNCMARICGRTGDHGIDLIVVESERSIAVQVKRRSQADAVERVMQVRELLGASLVEGFDHLMYVSTADHFSSGQAGAQQFANEAVARRVVESFELVDRHRFLEMLGLIPKELEDPWRAFVPPILLIDRR
jgi:restriction system protein